MSYIVVNHKKSNYCSKCGREHTQCYCHYPKDNQHQSGYFQENYNSSERSQRYQKAYYEYGRDPVDEYSGCEASCQSSSCSGCCENTCGCDCVKDNCECCNCCRCCRGPEGPMGPAGPEGPMGPRGLMGPMGPRGPVGPRGIQGEQGEQGPMGPTGPQGLIGPQGATGPAGPTGATGPQGIQGITGPQGIQGVTGPQGATGPIGPVGPTGPTPTFNSAHIGAVIPVAPLAVSEGLDFYMQAPDPQLQIPGPTGGVPFNVTFESSGSSITGTNPIKILGPHTYLLQWSGSISTIDPDASVELELVLDGVPVPGSGNATDLTGMGTQFVPMNGGAILTVGPGEQGLELQYSTSDAGLRLLGVNIRAVQLY